MASLEQVDLFELWLVSRRANTRCQDRNHQGNATESTTRDGLHGTSSGMTKVEARLSNQTRMTKVEYRSTYHLFAVRLCFGLRRLDAALDSVRELKPNPKPRQAAV
jgi:hypothetical protein